ncbi:hypothetical protein EGR52_09290 [bacterium]|nr:hypothetical protein [bacterium]
MKANARNISLTVIFLLILVVLALLIGKFTFSYLAPDIKDDIEGQGEVTASGDTLIFTKGNNLSLKATTDNFNGASSNLTSTTNPSVKLVASNKTNNATATYYAGIKINSNTYKYSTDAKTAEIILTVLDENGDAVTTSADDLSYVTVNGVSGFDITEKVGVFNISVDHPIATKSSTSGTTHTWTFTLTFINLETDQSINEDGSLEMEAILQKEKIIMPLTDYVKAQYISQGANNLYLHDNSLTNGANDGSYRYAGPSDTTNNFVCFGYDSTDGTCPSDNLYRIIGVFGDEVKLIKYDYAKSTLLGTDGDYYNTYKGMEGPSSYGTNKGQNSKTEIGVYYWNNNTQNNTWSDSRLNTVNLNKNYINNIGTKWSEKISDHTWKVGGNTDSKIYSQTAPTAYQNEINSPATDKTVNAKVGLMYVSDYGYAASSSAWSTVLNSYSNVIANNWMYMGLVEWTLAPQSGDSNLSFIIDSDGYVNLYTVEGNGAARPVLYLKSTISYAGGSGDAAKPILVK